MSSDSTDDALAPTGAASICLNLMTTGGPVSFLKALIHHPSILPPSFPSLEKIGQA